MAEDAPPRSAEQRKLDTIARFETDIDAWVASAAGTGTPYLVPLCFIWDGATFTLATGAASPTGRNLQESGRVRLAIGPTRDVVMVEGSVQTFTLDAVPAEVADAFAARLWDARLDLRNAFFQITPRRIQAWREENELVGRELMRDGRWLA